MRNLDFILSTKIFCLASISVLFVITFTEMDIYILRTDEKYKAMLLDSHGIDRLNNQTD